MENTLLREVEEEDNVLVLDLDNTEKLSDLFRAKVSKENSIVYRSWLGEEDALDWVLGKSSKKFLITDEWTVAGFEFDTMIILGYDHQMNDISSVCQRAKAKLIVYQIAKFSSEMIERFAKFQLSEDRFATKTENGENVRKRSGSEPESTLSTIRKRKTGLSLMRNYSFHVTSPK